jgi:hypothetical protein
MDSATSLRGACTGQSECAQNDMRGFTEVSKRNIIAKLPSRRYFIAFMPLFAEMYAWYEVWTLCTQIIPTPNPV